MKYKGREQSSNMEDKRSQSEWSYLMKPEKIGVSTADKFQKNLTTDKNYSFQTDLNKHGS